MYLAITSLEPLRILLFRDGLVLFANAEYDLSEDTLRSKQVHLTNAAIARPVNQKGRKLASPTQDQLEAEYDNGGDDTRSWLTCVLNLCAWECGDTELWMIECLNCFAGCQLVAPAVLRASERRGRGSQGRMGTCPGSVGEDCSHRAGASGVTYEFISWFVHDSVEI